LSPTEVQSWVAVAGSMLAALLGLFKYFNYKTRRDRIATVGAAFTATVEALSSENETKRMAAAVLLRRFFDTETEQGEGRTPYLKETVEVIAGMLREKPPEHLQKVLADGLRYAKVIKGSDLQKCDLQNSFLGVRDGDDSEPLSSERCRL